MTMDSSMQHSSGSAFQAYTRPTGHGQAKGEGAVTKVSGSPVPCAPAIRPQCVGVQQQQQPLQPY
jgi:hypothetical protein